MSSPTAWGFSYLVVGYAIATMMLANKRDREPNAAVFVAYIALLWGPLAVYFCAVDLVRWCR